MLGNSSSIRIKDRIKNMAMVMPLPVGDNQHQRSPNVASTLQHARGLGGITFPIPDPLPTPYYTPYCTEELRTVLGAFSQDHVRPSRAC